MKSTDVRDELADGLESTPLPAMGPDGGPILTPARKIDLGPPRLCESGPCKHYHRLEVQLDAQNPMRERRASGQVVEYSRVYHTSVQHYCYPDVGIETVLGSEAVVACNRWAPVDAPRAQPVAYHGALASWIANRERELEIAEAARNQHAQPIELLVCFTSVGPKKRSRQTYLTEPADTSLESLLVRAAQKVGCEWPVPGMIVRVGHAGEVGEEVGNLTATPAQLDLKHGGMITVGEE